MPRLLLSACLLLTGLASSSAAEEPALPAKKSATSLEVRVAAYNAWLVPLFSKERPERRARLPAALRALKADVLCLQEIWSPGDKTFLCKALAASHPHAHPANGGLLVLSRFPIEKAAFAAYPLDDDLPARERMAGKGYLDTTLKTPAGALRVVTSHLAAMPHPGSPRSRQLRLLLDHLKAFPTLPLVLAADLNMPSVRAGALTVDYRLLLERGYVDANPPKRDEGGRWTAPPATRVRWPRSKGGAQQGWSRDYIVLRSTPGAKLTLSGFRQALDRPATALSDHNCLLVDLRLERVPPKKAADPKKEPR